MLGLRPALFRLIALAKAARALSWPTTLSFKCSSTPRNFSFSLFSMRETEIPVHLLRIEATKSSSTSFFSSTPAFFIFSHFSSNSLIFLAASGIFEYSISAAFSYLFSRLACSLSFFSKSICFFCSAIWLNTAFSFSNCAFKAFLRSFRFASSFSISFRRGAFCSLFSIFRASLSTSSVSISRLAFASALGSLSICIFSSAAASSIRSIALSGKKRPLM